MKATSLIPTILLILLTFIANGQANCEYEVDTAKLLKNQNEEFISKLKGQSFAYNRDKAKIPKHVWQALHCFNSDFSLANHDEEWRSGCIDYGDLPSRKLVFFAMNDSFVVINYLHGGIGLHEHVLLMEFRNKRLVDFLPCTGISETESQFTTVKATFPFIRESKFEGDYFWIEI